jgi:sugar transferase (PEP-CTERM/EpsH1 system associated)
MAQFVNKKLYSNMLVDFVDVDSLKWDEYAVKSYFPFSWLYRRESQYLLRYERHLALQARHSFFVTEKERDIFSKIAPESQLKTSALNNGVDSDFFSPSTGFLFPFEGDRRELITIVFTGAMDYWPNINAVIWFVKHVFFVLVKKYSNIRFYIVGRNPSQAVLDLNSDTVFVTGTVDDVRPYLQHATVVVAPLIIARGIQNKILEAMSMARPVVASTACVEAIESNDGKDILAAKTALNFIDSIDFLINNRDIAESIGCAARINIVNKYSWSSHLKGIDAYLDLKKEVILYDV